MNQARLLQLRSMPYSDYLATPEWQAKRKEALERDHGHCRLCGSREHLNVHHVTYARLGNEDLDDLTTLCQPCHEHFSEKQKQWDLVGRTHIPPAEVQASKNALPWEVYLTGLLLQNPDLNPHLCGIISAEDFSDEEYASIYRLLSHAYQTAVSETWERILPPLLMPSALRALERMPEEKQKTSTGLVKQAIQCATRLKRIHLLDENKKLSYLIRDADKSGDKDEMQRVLLQQMQIIQKLRTLDIATHLHG